MRTESWLGILLGLAVAAEAAAQSNEAAQTFREHVAARAEAALTAGEPVVKGEDGWLFPSAELRHLGVGPFWGAHAAKTARATNPDRVDPLPAIVDFHRQLTQAGIELWVVPVPPKAVIYPEKVFPKSEPGTSATVCLDSTLVAFYRSLAEQGVEVVDLTDALLAAKATATGPVYCRSDSHWSGPALTVAAQTLAAKLKQHAWHETVPRQTYAAETNAVTITGDLAADSRETVLLRQVGTGEPGRLEAIAPSEQSPVLLLGDSHNLVFHAGNDMHARGAGLPDQLAYELGHPVDLIAVRGSGATPARVSLLRKVRRDPHYLASKKVVIWCFTAREFTESDGWAIVPILP